MWWQYTRRGEKNNNQSRTRKIKKAVNIVWFLSFREEKKDATGEVPYVAFFQLFDPLFSGAFEEHKICTTD